MFDHYSAVNFDATHVPNRLSYTFEHNILFSDPLKAQIAAALEVDSTTTDAVFTGDPATLSYDPATDTLTYPLPMITGPTTGNTHNGWYVSTLDKNAITFASNGQHPHGDIVSNDPLLVGDTQLRGYTDLGDYSAVVQNLGSGTTWSQGNFFGETASGLAGYTATLHDLYTEVDPPGPFNVAVDPTSPTSKIDLEFTDVNPNPGDGSSYDHTHYDIQRWDPAQSKFVVVKTFIDTDVVDDGNGTLTFDWSDTGLPEGSRQWYRVKERNADATSNWITPKTGITTLLTAPDPTVTATVQSAASVQLDFTYAGPAGAGFKVYAIADGQSVEDVSAQSFENAGTASQSLTVTDLSASTHYTFLITATTADTESAPASQTATTHALPAAPASATAGVSGGTVTVTWPASTSTVDSYNIYASTDNGTTRTFIDTVTADELTDSVFGLSPTTSTKFYVTAVNADGESAFSPASNAITTPAVPSVPTGLTPTLAGGNIVLTWTGDATLATGYTIYVKGPTDTDFTYLDSVDGSTTTYTTDGLTAGGYQFKVTATNASGESARSGAASKAVPTGISGVTAVASADGTTNTVSWTSDPSASGYLVYRVPYGSTGEPALAGTTGTGTFTEASPDATQAYDYTVVPYYTQDPPGSPDGAGSGSSASGNTYTGEIGSFDAVVNPDGSVTLTWSYQGDGSFELEDEDTDVPGTNFAFIDSPTGRSKTLQLTPGDHFNVRMRADNADGTASGYKSAPAQIPPTPAPTVPETLDAPSFSGGSVTSTVGWWEMDQATVNVPTSTQLPNVTHLFSLAAGEGERAGDTYHIDSMYLSGALGAAVGSEVGSTGNSSEPATISAGGTTGATYNLKWRFHDVVTGEYSHLSQTVPAVMGGVLPPGITGLSATLPDPSGNTSLTWSVPSGVENGTIHFLRVGRLNGQPKAFEIGSADVMTGQKTLSVNALPSDTNDVFAVYETNSQNGTMRGTSDYSNVVQIAGPNLAPAAPAYVTAVIDPKDDTKVNVHWQNTPGDETGYELERSDDNGAAWTVVENSSGDASSYQDELPADFHGWGSLVYAVRAYKDDVTSQPVESPVNDARFLVSASYASFAPAVYGLSSGVTFTYSGKAAGFWGLQKNGINVTLSDNAGDTFHARTTSYDIWQVTPGAHTDDREAAVKTCKFALRQARAVLHWEPTKVEVSEELDLQYFKDGVDVKTEGKWRAFDKAKDVAKGMNTMTNPKTSFDYNILGDQQSHDLSKGKADIVLDARGKGESHGAISCKWNVTATGDANRRTGTFSGTTWAWGDLNTADGEATMNKPSSTVNSQ